MLIRAVLAAPHFRLAIDVVKTSGGTDSELACFLHANVKRNS